MIAGMGVKVLIMLAPVLFALAACKARNEKPESAADVSDTTGRLVLQVESAQTRPDGRHCMLAVKARNDTGSPALNVQAAWMAQTEGFGIISDYQVLGDFAAGEVRSVQLAIVGAPCEALRELDLTRAVCSAGPAQDPPRSCADLVTLVWQPPRASTSQP